MNATDPNKLLITPDVLIIGGGSAGVAAAAGAFEQGATVTLIEKNAFAGGKATAACVGTVCGLYYRSEQPQARFVHEGFSKNFALQLAARSNTQPIHHKQGLHFLPYRHFEFMKLCDESLKASAHSFFFHASAHHAISENTKVAQVDTMIANKLVSFRPKSVIDTTGEDLMANLLPINAIKSDQYQAAAHVFQLSGLDEADATVLSLNLIRSIRKGISEGLLAPFFERVSLVPGSLLQDNVLVKLPLPHVVDNDQQQRTDLELFSRNAIDELVSFLKTHSDAFKKCNITFIAPEVGVRTGPRHKGKYILTGADVLSCRTFPDVIARGAWPIEYWEPGKPVHMEYFEMDDTYDIPAGVIQSNTLTNLFFGGRNISADDKAIASARVIGTCMATGYATGVLAAFNAFGKSQNEAIHQIQKAINITSVKHERT